MDFHPNHALFVSGGDDYKIKVCTCVKFLYQLTLVCYLCVCVCVCVCVSVCVSVSVCVCCEARDKVPWYLYLMTLKGTVCWYRSHAIMYRIKGLCGFTVLK